MLPLTCEVKALKQNVSLLEIRLHHPSGPVNTVQMAHISQHDDTNTIDTTNNADDIISIVVPAKSLDT